MGSGSCNLWRPRFACTVPARSRCRTAQSSFVRIAIDVSASCGKPRWAAKRVVRNNVYQTSEDSERRIIIDVSAPPVLWITRADLHAWVWAMPIADATAALGLTDSVGWHCWMIGINRPNLGHWSRLRRRRDAPIKPLQDRGVGPDAPVPLADFAYAEGDWEARVPPPTMPAFVGPPQAGYTCYPRDQHEPLPPMFFKITGRQRVRIYNEGPAGPPEPLRRSELHHLIWRADERETDTTLVRHGLSKRVAVKLAAHAGVRVPGPGWFGETREWVWNARDPQFGRLSKKTAPLGGQLVLFGADLRARFEAEAAAEEAAERAAAAARTERRRQAQADVIARAAARAELALPNVIRRVAAGERWPDACAAEGAGKEAVRRIAKRRLAELFAEWVSVDPVLTVSRIALGRATATDLMLLDEACLGRRENGNLRCRSATSRRYSAAGTPAMRAGLWNWINSASDVAEAQVEMAAILAGSE